MFVRYGTHYAADRKTVEIIIDKYKDAQNNSGKLRAHAGFDFCGSPASECCGAARVVHKADHHAEYYEKYDNTEVSGV